MNKSAAISSAKERKNKKVLYIKTNCIIKNCMC